MPEFSLLEETRKEIRCLVVSNPLNMTVNRLSKDYRDVIGQGIPYSRLGYKSLFDFLLSIPDVVQVTGRNPQFAILTPVVTENLTNLNKLIMKQKVTKPKYGCTSKRQTKILPSSDKPSSSSCNVSVRSYASSSSVSTSSKSTNRSISSRTSSTSDSYLKHDNFVNRDRHVSSNMKTEMLDSTLNQKDCNVKPITQPDLSHHISNKIRHNLKELIKSFPNGLNISFLAHHYQKYFKEKLQYDDMGFISALQFCLQLPDIFQAVRPTPTGDFLLFDARQELPVHVIENLKSQADSKKIDHCTNLDGSPEKSELYISNEVYPSDMMGPNDKIEILWLESVFVEGNELKIIITETYDPTKFWFVLFHEENFRKMNSIMDDMGNFYEETQKKYRIPSDLLQPNMYCAAYFVGSWHRAYVIQIMDPLKAKLFLIDYGTVCVIDTTHIRYLRKSYQSLPQQAIRGRLDYIMPKNSDSYWDLGITRYFIEQTKETVLLVYITEVEEENRVVWMVANQCSEENSASITINQSLVLKGYAEICPADDCVTKPGNGKLNSRRCMDYLWPLFHHLESGVILSFKELLRLDQKGFRQSYIMSEELKHLKISESARTNIDYSDNNKNSCNHFRKPETFRQAETKEELEWIEQFCHKTYENENSSESIEEPSQNSNSIESDEGEEELIRVYRIGGHDLHCLVIDYIVYIMTEEFLKKFVPFTNIEDLQLAIFKRGMQCRHITINLKTHENIFRALQSSNIPVRVEDESAIHLTPLRALDIILFVFKIYNPTLSKDICALYE